MGCHVAGRRSRRAEGDRVRDAIRSGVGALRRVRSVLHGSCPRRPRGVRPCRSSPGRKCAVTDADALRLFVSFPEQLVERPMIYEMVKRFDVIPNIRRANVEAHSGWVILELSGAPDARTAAIEYLEGVGCIVDRMEGDVVAG